MKTPKSAAILTLVALCLLSACAPKAPAPSPSPTAPVATPSAKEEEGVVELSAEQMAQAKIVVRPVSRDKISGVLQTSGSVSGDPDLEVKVSARVSGIVRSLSARVGDPVTPGQLLAVIDSPDVSQLKATYHSAQLEEELAHKNVHRRSTLARLGDATRGPLEDAQKEVAQARAALASASAADELARSQNKRLEALLNDGIASLQLVEEARARARQARAERQRAATQLELARAHLQRELRLTHSGLLYSGEVWEAKTTSERAHHAARHARDQLDVLGADPDTDDATVRLYAPIRGLVTERNVARGERTEAGKLLFSLVDTRRLWVWINLYDRDSRFVHLGTAVKLWPTGSPKLAQHGRISYLSPSLDPNSRTLRARVEVTNLAGRLRPNMFVAVEVATDESRTGILVPKSALIQVGGKSVVYVQDQPGHLRRRLVKTGTEVEQKVEILEGLKDGESIAVSGVFVIKSQDLKAELGEGE